LVKSHDLSPDFLIKSILYRHICWLAVELGDFPEKKNNSGTFPGGNRSDEAWLEEQSGVERRVGARRLRGVERCRNLEGSKIEGWIDGKNHFRKLLVYQRVPPDDYKYHISYTIVIIICLVVWNMNGL